MKYLCPAVVTAPVFRARLPKGVFRATIRVRVCISLSLCACCRPIYSRRQCTPQGRSGAHTGMGHNRRKKEIYTHTHTISSFAFSAFLLRVLAFVNFFFLFARKIWSFLYLPSSTFFFLPNFGYSRMIRSSGVFSNLRLPNFLVEPDMVASGML